LFNKYFFFISIIVLFSPASFPLANMFNNPNTPFENYPKPLQEAFAESQIGTVTRQSNYSVEVLAVNATHITKKFVGGLPEFIEVNGVFKNADVTEDANYLYLDARTPLKISKSTCMLIELDKARIKDNPATRKTTSYTLQASMDKITWADVQGSTSCSVSYNTNSTGTFITATQTQGDYRVDFIYAVYEDEELYESFYVIKNNDVLDRYVGILETHTVTGQETKIKFDGNEYRPLSTSVEKTDKAGIKEIKSEHIKTKAQVKNFLFVSEQSGKKPLFYDATAATEFLDTVSIKQDKGKLENKIFYYKKDALLKSGESYTIDPTFGYTEGTRRVAETADSLSTSCSTSGQSLADATLYKIFNGQSDANESCRSASVDWDISSISNTAIITNTQIRVDNVLEGGFGSRNCDIRGGDFTARPSTLANTAANAKQVWDEGHASTAYATNNGVCLTTQTDTVIDLGTTADSDVQTALSQDWYGIFFHYTDETRDPDSDLTKFGAVDIEITYTDPVKQNVRFRLFESDGTTAVASASIIVRNSTATQTQLTNATGVTPIFGLMTSTNHNVTAKTSTNYVVYKQFNWQPTANITETRTGNIFDVSGCTGTIGNLMTNDTNRHYVASVPLTPSCSSNLLTWNYFFKPLGIGPSPSNQTTTVRMEVSDRYCRSQTLYVNGSAITMTCSSNVLTSSAIQVGTGNQNVILKFRVTLQVLSPNAVTTLTSTGQTVSTVGLSWSQPNLNGLTLLGYQINYTTPWNKNPATRLVNNTNSSATAYTVSGLTFATEYSFRIGVWTNGGINATGNVLNVTTTGSTFTIGELVVNQTNTDVVDIQFERIDINSTHTFVNVTYSDTMDLDCNVYTKFARTNRTYTNLSNVTIDSNFVESSFLFRNADREIIDILCWNSDTTTYRAALSGNTTHAGTYLVSWSQFPLLDQMNSFRAGEYGTQGKFGVLDFITLAVVILSMIAFNRVNETVGAVFNIILLGALSYFGIIVLPTLIFGALATAVVLIVSTTRKD